MENFRRNNRSGERGGGRRNDRGFNDRNSGRSTVMHKAVCSECGRDCEVPFRPTGDKPVFCSNCFSSRKGAEPRRSDRRDSRRFDSGNRTMYKAICDKCGKECEVPFKPSSDKPIYCSQCFSKGGSNKSSGQINNQFDTINAKLDKILKVLNSPAFTGADEKKKTIEEKKAPKLKKVSKNKKKVSLKKVKEKNKK